MAVKLSVSLCWMLLLLFVHLVSSKGPQLQQVTAHPGENVTLPCLAPNNINISAVEWTRTDLQSYVYFQRGRHPLTQDQDPSFVDRVHLKGKMKDGDLSLILKNVNSNDTGEYECRYKERGGGHRKRALTNSEPISIFFLNVKGHTAGNIRTEGDKDGGDKDGNMQGHDGLIVGLSVAAGVIVVGFVIFMIYKRKKNSSLPPDEEAGNQQISEIL